VHLEEQRDFESDFSECEPDWRSERSWIFDGEAKEVRGKPFSKSAFSLSLAAHGALIATVLIWSMTRPTAAISFHAPTIMVHLVSAVPGDRPSRTSRGPFLPAEGSSKPHPAVVSHHREVTTGLAIDPVSSGAVGRLRERGQTGNGNRERTDRNRSKALDESNAAAPIPARLPAAESTGPGGRIAALNPPSHANGRSGDGQPVATNEASPGAFGDGAGIEGAHAVAGLMPAPEYPDDARLHGEEGTVMLLVTVAADGTVKRVTVSASSGYDDLDESALETVRDRWKFAPARAGGGAIESSVLVPIRFMLTDPSRVDD
jgi:TonB family protein